MSQRGRPGAPTARWRRGSQEPEKKRGLALGGTARAEDGALLERMRRWGFIVALAWAPLPLGSNRPWAWSLLALVTAALLALSAAPAVADGNARLQLAPLRWPGLIALMVILWALLQALPGGLLGWHHPLWDQAAEVLATRLSSSLAIDRERVFVHLLKLLTYGGVFLLAWQIGQRAEHARLLLKAVALLGALYAAYGLFEFASPHPSILWMRKWAYSEDVTSTFVNRNSFATFAGLAVIANLALVGDALIRHADGRSTTTLLLSTVDSILWRSNWPVLGFAVTGCALLLSHSRAGVLAAFCGVLALAGAIARAPSLTLPGRRPFTWFVAAAALAAAVVSGAGTIARLVNPGGEFDDGRGEIFRATLAAIGDNPWGGIGLGGFQFVYPMYESVWADGFIVSAHNDYLENMLELGVPAGLLLFAAVALLVFRCARGVFERRRDALYPCAALAASVLVAVHSFFDFSLQIPAVSVFYAALLGAGTAQAISSRQFESESAPPPARLGGEPP
jgi:O-antigen ligase